MLTVTCPLVITAVEKSKVFDNYLLSDIGKQHKEQVSKDIAVESIA